MRMIFRSAPRLIEVERFSWVKILSPRTNFQSDQLCRLWIFQGAKCLHWTWHLLYRQKGGPDWFMILFFLFLIVILLLPSLILSWDFGDGQQMTWSGIFLSLVKIWRVILLLPNKLSFLFFSFFFYGHEYGGWEHKHNNLLRKGLIKFFEANNAYIYI